MVGLEKVLNRIISEAEEDAGKLLRSAEEKAAAVNAAADEKIRAMRESVKQETVSEGDGIFSRAASAAEMKKRNIILSAKGASLDRTFAAAEEALCNLPGEEYVGFLESLVCGAVSNVPDITGCVISLNERDISAVSGKLLSDLGKRFPDISFGLSDKPAGIPGGVMLDLGEIDVDCSVPTVVARFRPELEGNICDMLFESARTVK